MFNHCLLSNYTTNEIEGTLELFIECYVLQENQSRLIKHKLTVAVIIPVV